MKVLVSMYKSVVLVVLAFILSACGADHSQRVEELVTTQLKQEMSELGIFGDFVGIEITALSCSKTKDNRVKNNPYLCNVETLTKDKFFGTNQFESSKLVIDYNSNNDEIVEVFKS